MAYEIGYKRPPKSGQFPKGRSGNPKGRPKGSRNFMTLLEKELGQSIVVSENGVKKTLTRLQAMVKRLVADALQGDRKSLFLLLDTLRRTDRLEIADKSSLLPEGYEAILEAYVERRRHAPPPDQSPVSSSSENRS